MEDSKDHYTHLPINGKKNKHKIHPLSNIIKTSKKIILNTENHKHEFVLHKNLYKGLKDGMLTFGVRDYIENTILNLYCLFCNTMYMYLSINGQFHFRKFIFPFIIKLNIF